MLERRQLDALEEAPLAAAEREGGAERQGAMRRGEVPRLPRQFSGG